MIIDHTLTGELHSRYDSENNKVDMHVIDAGGSMFSVFFSQEQLNEHIRTMRRLSEAFDDSRHERDVQRWIDWAEENRSSPKLKAYIESLVERVTQRLPRAPINKPEDGAAPGWEEREALTTRFRDMPSSEERKLAQDLKGCSCAWCTRDVMEARDRLRAGGFEETAANYNEALKNMGKSLTHSDIVDLTGIKGEQRVLEDTEADLRSGSWESDDRPGEGIGVRMEQLWDRVAMVGTICPLVLDRSLTLEEALKLPLEKRRQIAAAMLANNVVFRG